MALMYSRLRENFRGSKDGGNNKNLTNSKVKNFIKRSRNGALAAFFVAIQLASPVSSFLILNRTAPALAADTGFQSPTATLSPNDWSNPSNAFSSNNSYTTATSDNADQGYSNFGFSVPAGSTINGIEVSAEALASTSAGSSIFSDGFGTGDDNNSVGSGWSEGGGDSSTDGTIAKQSTSGVNSASPDGGRFALIAGNGGYICRTVNTTGYTSPQLSYYWRGDADAEDNELGVVEYRSAATGNCSNGTWTAAASHELDDGNTGTTAWSSLQTVNLPANSSLFVRFRAASNSAGESFRIDGVSVTGTPSVSAELQVRLSGNGGSGFTSRQTVNLTGTEIVHTLGGAANLWGSSWTPSSFTNANFRLEIRLNNPAAGVTASLDHIQVKVYYTPPIEPVGNPPLAQACGLDIALVIDRSTSISSGEMTSMKSALKAFVDALDETPTQFSVTRFATTSSVAQSFTANSALVTTAIDGTTTGGGFTNWEAGLSTANSTFDPRAGVPNLVLFATDGDPTTSGNGNSTDTGQPNAHLAPAITAANTIKGQNTRIVTIGIGLGSGQALTDSTNRLKQISGPVDTGPIQNRDVIITDNFVTLANDLKDWVEATCGGTITTTKLIDDDNNPATDPIKGAGWDFLVNGNTYTTDNNGQTVAVDVDAGTYSVKETVKDGYKVIGASCKISNKNDQPVGAPWVPGSDTITGIVVSNTDAVSCEFINVPTRLIVKKVVVGGPSEGKPQDFSFKVGGGNAVPFESDGENVLIVTPDTYTVTEANTPQHYHASYDNCSNVVVPLGGTVTCTITNTYAPAPGTIELKKVWSGTPGQTTLKIGTTIGGSEVDSQQTGTNGAAPLTTDQNPVQQNTYYVSESNLADYTASLACFNDANNNGVKNDNEDSVTVGANNSVAVGSNQHIICTFVNTRHQGGVKVNKLLDNDGNGSYETTNPAGFTWSLNGAGTNAMGSTVNNIDTGSHSVTENAPIGYIFVGWYVGGTDSTQFTCANAPGSTLPAQVNVTKDTVTEITLCNKKSTGVVSFAKEVLGGGPATPIDWTFHIFFNDTEIDQVQHGDSESYTTGSYAVTESGQYSSLYNLTGASGICSLLNGVVTMLVTTEGGTCTLTNTRKTGTLKVVKDVVNDHGGTKTSNDFTFKVNGGDAQNFDPTTSPDGEKVLVVPTGTYTVTEPEANTMGYATSYNNCKNIVVVEGQTQTCTITNNDKPAKVKVIKKVENNDGGKAKSSDFTMTVSGTNVSNPSFPGSSNGTNVTLNAGNFTVSELPYQGYEAFYSGDCSGTIANGQEKTCTVTNKDVAPKLRLKKKVINNNGGTAEATEWKLKAAKLLSSPVINEYGQNTGYDTATTNWASVKANEKYYLSESGPHGYDASDWYCYGGGDLGSNLLGTYVELEVGEEVTCKIVNDDKQAKVIVSKIVLNDNGGTKQSDDFTMTVSGTNVSNPSFPGNLLGTWVYMDAGSFSVDEEYAPGYEKSFLGDCSGDIKVGEVKICIVKNRDIAPKLTLVKEVINNNSGQAGATDWTLTAEGPKTISGQGGVVSGSNFKAGTYDLNETGGPEGYSASDWVCVGGGQQNGASITLDIGEEATCTITNDDIANPGIQVEKSGPASAQAGTTVTYTFVVTNTGDVALDNVTVNDDIAGMATYQSGDTDNDSLLDVDETWIFTADYTIPAGQVKDVVNTATVCGFEHIPVRVIELFSTFGLVQLDNYLDEYEQETEEPVCDTDSHTTTIPQVLAETTDEPAVLTDTGSALNWLQLFVPVILSLVTFGVYRLTRKETTV